MFLFDIILLLSKIYSHFSISAQRKDILLDFISYCSGDDQEFTFENFKSIIKTRFYSICYAATSVQNLWDPLAEYFAAYPDETIIKNLLFEGSTTKVNPFAKCTLDFITFISSYITRLIKIFEKKDACYCDMIIHIKSYLKSMNEMKE